MAKLAPPTCKQVKTALKSIGFELRPARSGSSHEKWVKTSEDASTRWVVTVDCPKAPFSHDLIKSMAKQAGLDKKVFHELCMKF